MLRNIFLRISCIMCGNISKIFFNILNNPTTSYKTFLLYVLQVQRTTFNKTYIDRPFKNWFVQNLGIITKLMIKKNKFTDWLKFSGKRMAWMWQTHVEYTWDPTRMEMPSSSSAVPGPVTRDCTVSLLRTQQDAPNALPTSGSKVRNSQEIVECQVDKIKTHGWVTYCISISWFSNVLYFNMKLWSFFCLGSFDVYN